jgi:hypothetical protein
MAAVVAAAAAVVVVIIIIIIIITVFKYVGVSKFSKTLLGLRRASNTSFCHLVP